MLFQGQHERWKLCQGITSFRAQHIITLGDSMGTCITYKYKQYTGLFEMTVGVLTTSHTPRSPDATPYDFFLWGYVKDQVYVPPLQVSQN